MSYIANRSNAAAMIARKGSNVTLVHETDGDYDAATGTIDRAITTATVKGVVLPLSSGFRKVGEGSVIGGDQQLILAALDTDGTAIEWPSVNDRATIGGTVYTLADVKPLTPDGITAIMFDCIIRGAP